MLKPKIVIAILLCLLANKAAPAQTCSAHSGAKVPQVVELYTSEGCSSCPSADQWLSSLKGRSDVLAIAFHVDYWDRLGWKDRFASPDHTARQVQSMASSGARFAYTPQLILNGRDWRSTVLPAASNTPAGLAIELQRTGPGQVALSLRALDYAPARVRVWWVAVEDGHVSQVKAGENHGVTLKHDHVVRDYARLPVWETRSATQSMILNVKASGEGDRPRRLIVVASDENNGRVLQAVQLDC
jgi:hypothetical protein